MFVNVPNMGPTGLPSSVDIAVKLRIFFCWSKTHFCDNCHKPGVWGTLTTMTTGANKKQIWEYSQCPGLKPAIESVQKDASLNAAQKLEAFGKLRSDAKTCPLGIRHPPNGLEFGMGCSMCADKNSDEDNARAAAEAKREEEEKKGRTQLSKQLLLGKTFRYVSDFDTNGLLHAIGTLLGTKTWSNPGESGQVVVTSSVLQQESVASTAIVGRQVVHCVSQPYTHSWFIIDLVDKYLIPSHYTLRHFDFPMSALRSWRLEGSVDSLKWEILTTQANDCFLNARGSTHTWQLNGTNKTRFRLFRFVQTGKNSSNTDHFALSGVEFYGTCFASSK